VLPPPSLYRRLLGPRFDELPGALRRFHDTAGGGRARGVFQVERGRGWLRNAVASLLGFPRAGVNLLVTLEVVVETDREQWRRRFPDETVVSTQWERNQLLIEKFGVGSFSCCLKIAEADLVYEFRQAWLAGVPFPSWFSPRVNGHVTGEENGWRVVVRVIAPILGEILHYEGRVEPE
jgi:hypothetical protein